MDSILTNSPSPIRIDKKYINIIFSNISSEIQTSTDARHLDDSSHTKKSVVSRMSVSYANNSVDYQANDNSWDFCEAVKQRRSIQSSTIARRVSVSNRETDLESDQRLYKWKAEEEQLLRQLDISMEKAKREYHVELDEWINTITTQKKKIIDVEKGEKNKKIQEVNQQATIQNQNQNATCNLDALEIKKIEKVPMNQDIQTKQNQWEGSKLKNDQLPTSVDSRREEEKRRLLQHEKELKEQLRMLRQMQANQAQGGCANNSELNESNQMQVISRRQVELNKPNPVHLSQVETNQVHERRLSHMEYVNDTHFSEEFNQSKTLFDNFIALKSKNEVRTAEIRSSLSLLIGQLSGDHTDNELYCQIDKLCSFMIGRVEVPMFTDFRRKIRIEANNETEWRLALAILFHLISEECETKHFEKWERALNLAKALSSLLSMKNSAASDFLRYFSYLCPFLIPYDPPKETYRSELGYFRATCRNKDGTFGHPSERINGIIHVYISVLLVRPHNNMQKSALLSPHRLWRMLAGFFRQPDFLRETNPFANEVILRVICCAGATLNKIYDTQFKKLIDAGLKSLSFSKEPPRGRPWSTSSLERILKNALEEKFVEASLV